MARKDEMTLEGETIGTGASPRCPDCNTMSATGVYSSMAGYYIGTWCECGPYSRESGYYTSYEAAEHDLTCGLYGRA